MQPITIRKYGITRDQLSYYSNFRISHRAETQENDLKTNFIKMIEVLNEEMTKPLKEIQENTNNGMK